jgi:hypothetical protein
VENEIFHTKPYELRIKIYIAEAMRIFDLAGLLTSDKSVYFTIVPKASTEEMS